MRVALISDLHGNEVALDAVLDDLAKVGVDRVVCLGDTATLGPRPGYVLARLRALGCVCILGNHDEFLLDEKLIERYSEAPVIRRSVDWCRAELSTAELDFVRTFQPHAELPLDGGASLLLFHGTPRSHMEDLLATTPPDQLDQFLDGRRAAVMAGGHTHVQLVRQHRGILIVNPGSLGMPFREHVGGREPEILPHAEYATVESEGGRLGVTLRRVELDVRAHRATIASSALPLGEMLLRQYPE